MPPVFLKPMSAPHLPAIIINLVKDTFNPSGLKLHFSIVQDPDVKGYVVKFFLIQWSIEKVFHPSATDEVTSPINLLSSDQISLYDNVAKPFIQYNITRLVPGVAYFVRIAAINEAGVGRIAPSNPSCSLRPGQKLSILPVTNGVILSQLRHSV